MFRLSPENELLTESQCKGITEASILHNVDDPAPAEGLLPLHKPAQLLKGGVIWLAMQIWAPASQTLSQQLSLQDILQKMAKRLLWDEVWYCMQTNRVVAIQHDLDPLQSTKMSIGDPIYCKVKEAWVKE